MQKAKKRAYLDRKIYFYRLYVGQNAAGAPLPCDVPGLLTHIKSLEFDTGDRYLGDENGEDIACWVDGPQKIRFGKIKRTNLPQTEHQGKIDNLHIPSDHGLIEFVHVEFFSENVVGIEFNYDGPRVGLISQYLNEKCKHLLPKNLEFQSLLQQDALKKLESVEISRFQLKIRDSFIPSLKGIDDNLAAAFGASIALGQAREVTLVLSRAHYAGSLGDKLRNTLKRLLAFEDTQNGVLYSQIKGSNKVTGESTTIDLLNEKLVAVKRISRENTSDNSLKRELVYGAIREAYTELKDQITNTPGVTLWTA